MKEIGEFLKSSRIKNGVSIEEASEDLNISVIELENVEEGNIRAFKDVFGLREIVKSYGKYLGVETDAIINEFNDFMFEHTSKISLDDIKEAKKITEEEKPKIVSPYTYIRTPKFNLNKKKVKILITIISVIIIFIIGILILINLINKKDITTSELQGRRLEYELTY